MWGGGRGKGEWVRKKEEKKEGGKKEDRKMKSEDMTLLPRVDFMGYLSLGEFSNKFILYLSGL